MKIIKRGKHKKKKMLTRFKCCYCGCVFEIDDKEFAEHATYVGTYAYSKCPECGEQANEVIMR